MGGRNRGRGWEGGTEGGGGREERREGQTIEREGIHSVHTRIHVFVLITVLVFKVVHTVPLVPQFRADNACFPGTPPIVADCPPVTVVTHFHPPLRRDAAIDQTNISILTCCIGS